jgi:ubiquinone/menaquinone biosynthesis C-methylase UbiE
MGECRECAWWRGYLIDNRLRRIFHKPEKMLAPFVLPGMTAMDVGCGMGYFAVPMARMVGETGKVTAVDLQQERLDVLMRRASRAGVASRISPLKCARDDFKFAGPVDFALAFYFVHEIPDPLRVLRQIHACLKPGGALLLAEPSFEVTQAQFDATIALAQTVGFCPGVQPKFCVSRAMLLAAGQPLS